MKRFVRVALALAMAWTLAGCGSVAEHDKAVDYTPESLAQELAFRYRSLADSKKKVSKGWSKAIAATEREAAAKGRPATATKKAQVENADDMLDEIAAKALKIRSAPPAEIFQKMADAVSRDQSLGEKDRQTLAGKLEEMAEASR